VLISSRRLSPNAFTRCTRSTVSFDRDAPRLEPVRLGVSRNRKANSFENALHEVPNSGTPQRRRRVVFGGSSSPGSGELPLPARLRT
jgi:hypothetical protein